MAARTNEQTEIQKRPSRAKARTLRKELSTELFTKKISWRKNKPVATLPLCISFSQSQNKAQSLSSYTN